MIKQHIVWINTLLFSIDLCIIKQLQYIIIDE